MENVSWKHAYLHERKTSERTLQKIARRREIHEQGCEEGKNVLSNRSGNAKREFHMRTIKIRDCRIQPSLSVARAANRPRHRLLVHATVILNSRLFYLLSYMRDSVISTGCIHYDECRARSLQQSSYSQQILHHSTAKYSRPPRLS